MVRFGFDIEELPDDDSYQHWIRNVLLDLAKEEDKFEGNEDPWKEHNLKYKVVHEGETLITYDGKTTDAFERVYSEQINR